MKINISLYIIKKSRRRRHRVWPVFAGSLYVYKYTKIDVTSREESAALGRRIPWANRLFSKSMEGKVLNFLHEVEKMISVISVQV